MTHAPFLLILDDLWLKDLDIVNPLLRMVNPGCALVLTTRWRKVADDLGVLVGSKQIPVDELDEKDALTLLTEICQNKPTDPDLLHSLVKAAGGLPLTLEVIGASIIASQHSVPLDGQRLQQIEKRWHLSGATGSHHLSPQEAIDRSVKNLPDRQTQRAFLALGTFAPKPATFSKDAARYVTGANQEILQTLCNCNLLHESSRDRYMFHQSLSKAAQAHLNTNDAAYSRHSIYYRKQVERTTSHKQNERDELKDIDWRTLFLDLSQIRAIRLPEHPASVFSIIINRLSNAIPWLQSLNHHLPGWLKDVLSRILQAGLVLFRIAAHATGQKQIEAILSNYQGWLYAEIGDRGHALTHYTRAYELWDTPGPDHRNDLRRAQVLNNLGKTYYMQARYREAIRAYYHALDIYQTQNNQSLQAHVHTNIGATFDMIGWVHWAIQNFHTALCLYRQVHDERGEALSLHHLGVAYNGLGKREKALTSLEKALSKHTQANNDVGRARTLMELGSVYLDSASVAGQEQASLETAMEYFQEALELQKMFDDRAWQGRTLNRIGQVYAKQGNTRQALDIYLQALLIHQNVNYHAGLSTTLGLISNLFSKAGKDIWARAITNEAKSEHSHYAHLELIFKQLLNVE